MKKIVFLLFLTACYAAGSLPRKKNELTHLIGWWERYYPDGHESSGEWNLSHIEFMDDRKCRYAMGEYEGEKYISGTYNDMKWRIDTAASSIFVYSPYDTAPYFNILITELSKSSMTGFFSLSKDTLFMKKLPKLH